VAAAISWPSHQAGESMKAPRRLTCSRPSLPFVLLPAWLIVRVGLRPLRAVAQALEARGAADLAPLPASPYRELVPVVDAVNNLMRRLSERLAREHEFLADAAHELKTPLSVVQINAHLLESAANADQRHDAGAGLRDGVARATHTVHQLLAFERARQEPTDTPQQHLDLAALRAQVFERFYRVPGQDQAGSGLGLAIAERAAARNGARIVLGAGPGGRGLAVRIEFTGGE
jgi:signal transduction histidine kinase